MKRSNKAVVLITLLYGMNQGVCGLLCYSCSGISTSEECMNVIECTGREECFARADGFINGSVHYTIGCTYDMVPVVVKGQTFCSEVCSEDLCNLDKCQLPVSPRSNIIRPPRCLSCDLINDPALCKNLVQCQRGEMCFVRKVATYGNTRYRLGCMDMQHCSGTSMDHPVSSAIIGKRSDQSADSCSLCCSKDHCNVKACGKRHTSPLDDHTYNLHLLGDEKTCFDFNPTACAAFGNLDAEACKVIADVDNLCPSSCGMCGHYGWTEWGGWSSCSKSCDSGLSVRYRTCIHQLDAARNKTCVGAINETKTCNVKPCAIHGQWSDWGEWNNCSVTCENGTRTRHRDCDNPVPQFGGTNCTGDSVDIGDCSEKPCPIHGGWCFGNGQTCSYSSFNGRYRLQDSNARIRTSCACPAPQYGGEQCQK